MVLCITNCYQQHHNVIAGWRAHRKQNSWGAWQKGIFKNNKDTSVTGMLIPRTQIITVEINSTSIPSCATDLTEQNEPKKIRQFSHVTWGVHRKYLERRPPQSVFKINGTKNIRAMRCFLHRNNLISPTIWNRKTNISHENSGAQFHSMTHIIMLLLYRLEPQKIAIYLCIYNLLAVAHEIASKRKRRTAMP